MKRFSILVKLSGYTHKKGMSKYYIESYTPIFDIPPVSVKINDGLWYFNGDIKDKKHGAIYQIDMSYDTVGKKNIPQLELYNDLRMVLFKRLEMDHLI